MKRTFYRLISILIVFSMFMAIPFAASAKGEGAQNGESGSKWMGQIDGQMDG